MNEVDRHVIQLNIDTLTKDTNFTELLGHLLNNKNIITNQLKKKYEEMKENGASNTSLNLELYKDIQTRGENTFDTLIVCLKKTQPDLAELLQPNERIHTLPSDERGNVDESSSEHGEFEGICTASGGAWDPQFRCSVINLCQAMKAKFVSDDINLTPANFHLAIKAGGVFQEEDIQTIESLYTDNCNLKIIIINIIPGILDNDAAVNPSANELHRTSGRTRTAVFIVNIHIHKGDNISSVIDIIKEIVANNAGSEIRDIFRMVMEKLKKWCCRLNTESRSFPQFRF